MGMRRNWSGNYEYRARALLEPTTLDQLAAIVTGGAPVRALASRHSFNGISDTEGAQVSLAGLPGALDIDAAARIVTVPAQLRYGDVATELDRAGWALHNLASLPHISVAGAVSTATHGSGTALGNLASAVVGLELMTATGELVMVRPGHPDFAGAVVGLGSIGIVTRLELRIEPGYLVAQTVYTGLGWDAVQRDFPELMDAGYSVSLFTDWGESGIQQVWVKRRVDRDTVATPERLRAVPATVVRHPILGAPAANATEQGGRPGPWHERLPHFRLEFTPSSGEEIQSEYLVALRDAAAAIDAIRSVAPRFSNLLMVGEIRTVAADGLWMSTAYERDSVAFHFTWVRDQRAVEAVLPTLEAALAPFAPRPHWGKAFTTSAEELASIYPRMADFRDLLDRWDANRTFRNAFIDATIFGV
jgi:xylitol oxidase